MLFSEIYGSYFNVVAAVLSEAAENTLTTGKLTAIVQEKAFAESVLSIPAALQSGTGQRLPYGAARKADNAFNHFAKAMAEGPSLRSEDRFIRSRHERSRRRGTVIYPGYLRPV